MYCHLFSTDTCSEQPAVGGRPSPSLSKDSDSVVPRDAPAARSRWAWQRAPSVWPANQWYAFFGGVFPFQSVLPFFVATKLAKIRKTTLQIPSAETYVRSALKTVGLKSRTNGYLIHSLMVGRGLSPKPALGFRGFPPPLSHKIVYDKLTYILSRLTNDSSMCYFKHPRTLKSAYK